MEDGAVNFVREIEIRQSVCAAFDEMRALLEELLPRTTGAARARIEHVGSTSVPGSITKGDLDVCVLVVEARAFAAADGVLAGRFRRNAGSDRSGSFASFIGDDAVGGDAVGVGRGPAVKVDGVGGDVVGVGRVPAVGVGIQLVLCGGPEDDFLRWRDLLRRAPQVLEAYNDLKRQWHGRPHDEYRRAKSRFIEDALSSASGAASASPADDRG